MQSSFYTGLKQIPGRICRIVSLVALVFSLLFFIGCGGKPKQENAAAPAKPASPPPQEPGCHGPDSSFTFVLNKVEVEIKSPAKPLGRVMLILPGWNFPRTDWCEKSRLCDSALAAGYHLVLPEMGKSIYASEVYPETRKDWLKYKTGTWLRDTLIPILQKEYCLLIPGGKNHVAGLSTGGRGAVLTALYLPGLFLTCSTLSGDYDQRLMQDDNLMSGWYGPFDKFPDRWGGSDNIAVNANKLKTPVFIGHGRKDKVIGEEQGVVFNQILLEDNPNLFREFHLDEAQGHDYKFWDSKVQAVLNFCAMAEARAKQKI